MHSDHDQQPTEPQLARAHAEHRKTVEFYRRLEEISAHHNPRFSITNSIVALNAVMFVIMGLLGAGWLMPGDANMLAYMKYGANNGAATTNGEWWRLVTSMFMHYGILHIAVNMWALYQAGAFLEKLQGRFVYLLTYLACGVSGGFASIIWHGDKTWSAGASGAVFGVYGAILGYMLRERSGLPSAVYKPIIKSTATFAAYNLAFGAAMSFVDNAAHIGGLLCGIVFGALLAQPLDMESRRARRLRTFSLAGVLVGTLLLCGMQFSPRFNYSVTDELAWETQEKAALDKLDGLNTPINAALSRFNSDHNAGALSDWVNIHLLPVYRDTLNDVSAPRFDPAQITARRQKLLADALRENLQNWTAFSTSLANGRTLGLSAHIQRDGEIFSKYIRDRDSLRYERLP